MKPNTTQQHTAADQLARHRFFLAMARFFVLAHMLTAHGHAELTGGQAQEPETEQTRIKAPRGDAAAQHEMARMFARGEGARQDFEAAAHWYRKAAAQNFAPAQNELGRLYAGGSGVVRNDRVAFTWFRKAAEQNFAPAQCNLGQAYAGGLGVRRSDAEAIKWYRKAAAQGYAPALNRLGVMHQSGRAGAADSAEAWKWFAMAAMCEQGPQAAANMETLRLTMTVEQIAEAELNAAPALARSEINGK